MVQRAFFPKKLSREELNSLVDRAADLIRTAVDYKFILVLLFLKRLNDLWKFEKQQAVQRLVKEASLPEKEAEREAEKFKIEQTSSGAYSIMCKKCSRKVMSGYNLNPPPLY